ncbi:MAG TPA: protein-methionine-sulfoxide reductase heme-binding subunit MsrQ [Agitococcus sp.]|nr:protein-methionine-sulfoxide reductase heme-binding subunit MsrQ [Agitococcus sp.]HNG10232.1 protein-methionine-sulfoxide reductase heme-binding subunit MsrQ [Agitococcus sp.]HNH44197.1 protein-methionine-sulfoxide reductase heme-binding subunit MsrQ [Agitococcus sp.]HNJ87767.1 protein-methionine-sulfoxide reductase heme-binding subunit MsrQ [Agitococcus sp.]HNL79703.1 protein-methionine-sulfoxide reductase heme-binding subunit MsrQ [Agitococcus sp.]
MVFSPKQRLISKILLFIALLTPCLWLIFAAMNNQLGADPAKKLVDQTGLWAIQCLWLSLAMTPLKNWTGSSQWIQYRRMIGLFAFFYVLLHFLGYLFLLFGAQWAFIGQELTKRPYIIVGFTAFVLLIPLAISSTAGWQRRLKRRWLTLHKLVYIIAVLALIHFIWLKKLGIFAVWPYALVLFILFAERIRSHLRKKQPF